MIEFKNITDIDKLMAWRAEVIKNVFGQTPSEALLHENRLYYERNVPDGSHIAYIALFNDTEAGCGAICLGRELPSPDNPDGLCAYIMNIYVRPAFREHGIAHAIVKKLIEKARSLKCDKIYLETTDEARPVYQSLGFRDMPDMMKYYDTEFKIQ